MNLGETNMNSRVFNYVHSWTTNAVFAASFLALFYVLMQTTYFYFRDMSYQSAMLGTNWQSAMKDQCRTVPGCLDVKFVPSLTKPSKSASSLQLVGTHMDVQLSVSASAQGPALKQIQRYLEESRSRQVDLVVTTIADRKSKG
jgi:hypothetical protein